VHLLTARTTAHLPFNGASASRRAIRVAQSCVGGGPCSLAARQDSSERCALLPCCSAASARTDVGAPNAGARVSNRIMNKGVHPQR
jgi:hypothetical protein